MKPELVLRRRFSSIESRSPHSPTSPSSPNGDTYKIYPLPDDDDVFANEKEFPKENTIVPPPPTPGTAPSLEPKKSWVSRKLSCPCLVLIVAAVLVLLGLAVGIALAVIFVNKPASSSSSNLTQEIEYYGHLALSKPWSGTTVELSEIFSREIEIILNSSQLYSSFIKATFSNLSANNTILFFKLNFKPSLRVLEELNQDVSDIVLAKTVQRILRQQVVENAGNLVLSILSETVVILENIPVTESTVTTPFTSTMSSPQTESTSTTTTTTISGRCLPLTIEQCQSYLGETSFYLPNFLQHTHPQEAINKFNQLSGSQRPKSCSDSSFIFLCSLLFPSCKNSAPLYPCDSFCRVVKDECGDLAGWPLVCDQYPRTDCLAAPRFTSTPSTTSTSTSTTPATTTPALSSTPTSTTSTSTSTLTSTTTSTTSTTTTSTTASTTTSTTASSTSTTTSTTSTTPTSTTMELSSCVQFDFPLCNDFGFTRTYLPRTDFCDNVECLTKEFLSFSQRSLLENCTKDLSFFCGIYFPHCDDDIIGELLPCSETCEDAVAKCGEYMPYSYNCADFISYNKSYPQCIPPKYEITTTPSTTEIPPFEACVTLNYSFCADEGFNVTSERTIFTNSIAEAVMMFETYTNQTLYSACYSQSKFFFCGSFFPKCEQGYNLQYPCKKYCKELNSFCPYLRHLDCEKLPENDCLSPPATTTAPTTHAGATEPTTREVTPTTQYCANTEFKCKSLNKCIQKSLLCNQNNDCGDWSDEQNCVCDREFQFQCKMGMCIPSYKRCDGQFDCPDNTDEFNCTSCKMNMFKCNDGKCIMPEWLCDGFNDCKDWEDELNCISDPCLPSEIECRNKKCIPAEERCDGIMQCEDHSDEVDCFIEDNPFSVVLEDDLHQVCDTGFTNQHANTYCVRIGADSVLHWESKDPTLNQLFLLQADGNVISALGRGTFVKACPGKVAAVTCKPKVCGRPSTTLKNSIIGGTDARPGAWPWMVSIKNYNTHDCGGAIIDPYFILTAAHCVESFRVFTSFTVVAGTTVIYGSQKSPTEVTRKVRRAIIHPDYAMLKGNDIALIELKTPLVYNDYVKPICFPEADDVFTRMDKCYITGWGHLSGVRDLVPEVLQETKLTLMDAKKCNSSFMWDGGMHITESCAGYYNGMITACRGDSGSSVVCEDETSTWKTVGVASYVFRTCSVAAKPMVYSQTKLYVDWIKNQTICQFMCDDGICLFDKNMLCDAVNDCADGSDEIRLCNININCTFDDKFMCGYKTNWKLSYPPETAINFYPLFDHTLGRHPGQLLLGETRMDLISPHIQLNSSHCVRFFYHVRGNAPNGITVSAKNLKSNQYETVWKQTKIVDGPDRWLMGIFDLPAGEYMMYTRVYDNERIAIDDVLFMPGECENMDCLAGEIMCSTSGVVNCLSNESFCNLVIDCDDGEDEVNCSEWLDLDEEPHYVCDFENGNICALEQHSNDSRAAEWKMVNSSKTPNNIMDHTFHNSSGTLLKLKTHGMIDKDVVVMSQAIQLGLLPLCLQFFYASTSSQTLKVQMEVNNTQQTLLTFTNRQTLDWIPTQATIPSVPQPERGRLLYVAIGGDLGTGTIEKAIMLDDITITQGRCPMFRCPDNHLLCREEAYCLPRNKVCDRIVDCLQGNDEISCECTSSEFSCSTGQCIPSSHMCDTVEHCLDGSDEGAICDNKRKISCQFEDVFMCGYTVNTSINEFHWKRSNAETGLISSDHTFENTETIGSYIITDTMMGGDLTSLDSIPFQSAGHGLVFFYYSYYFNQQLQLDTGRLSFVITFTANGAKEEKWFVLPDDNKFWKMKCIDLPVGNITISFLAHRGSYANAIIAIDDILLLNESCDSHVAGVRIASALPQAVVCPETKKPCRNNMCLDISLFCDGVLDCLDGYDELNCTKS